MPAPPLFQSPRMQQLAVAIVMAIVFAGSLGLAYAMSVTRGQTGPAVHAPGFQVPEFRDWQRLQSAPLAGAAAFRDPNEPDRVLSVGSMTWSKAVTPQVVYHDLQRAALAPVERWTFRQLPSLQRQWQRGPLQVYELVGISENADGNGQVQHFIAVLTGNGQQYTVVYLRDAVTGDRAAIDQQLRQNLSRFRVYVGVLAETLLGG